MSTDSKPKAIGYSRFSPRPIKATCPCGWAWNVDATAETEIEEACPQCGAVATIRNTESCESQIADIRRHCSRRGWELVSTHMDKALSGSDACHDRPGLFDAKVACKRGYTLIVRNLDRLFRDMDKAALFGAEMRAKGVRILSLEQPEANGETATGKLMSAIYNWMAEIKREEIRARTRSKMLLYQAEGRKMSSIPPYGSAVDPANPKALLPNDEEQTTIAVVTTLHSQGLTFRKIARQLEANGVSRRGKAAWNHQLVKAILVRAGLVRRSH
jgi:DNA invertase Pin-like site-specific DNA recombinase